MPGVEEIKNNIVINIITQIKINYDLENEATIEPFDMFVVKYDMDGQTGLNVHRDSSEISFVLLLSVSLRVECVNLNLVRQLI